MGRAWIACVAIATLLSTALPLAAQPQQTAADFEWGFVAALNEARFSAGHPPLVVRDDLRRIARAWSSRMAADGAISHNPYVVEQVAAAAPDWAALAENVGRGPTVVRLHDALMASQYHRENILADVGYVGVGVVYEANTIWVTQVFLRAPAGAPAVLRLPATRLYGPSSVETALEVSRRTFADASAGAVVVARSDVFADALAGGPLAAVNSGPVLLTHQASVPAAVIAETRRVLRPGGTVYLMGGLGALSATVELAFVTAGVVPVRVAGSDRFATAAGAAALVNPRPSSVLIASGVEFPDALSAGVAAAVERAPILLTARGELPAATRTYLALQSQATPIIIGGTAAVSDAVASAAGATERIAGRNRYETAARVAERWLPDAQQFTLATGHSHQDALVGIAAAALDSHPLLLVPPRADAALYGYVRGSLDTLRELRIVGSPSTVRDGPLSLLFN